MKQKILCAIITLLLIILCLPCRVNANAHVIDAEMTLDNNGNPFATHVEWTKNDMNVRSGPGMQYGIIGFAPYETKIYCTNIVDGDWRQVIWNDGIAYIHADYLTESAPKHKITYGDDCRLVIPDVGIDVAVHYININHHSESQATVDQQDSAAYLSEKGVDLIADHRTQGFDGLFDAVPGTMAYLNYADGTQQVLECQKICRNGRNTGDYLLDDNGTNVYESGYPLFMYTCNPNVKGSVTVTYWSWVEPSQES